MAKLNILMIKAKMIFIGALTVSLVLGRALRTFLYGPYNMDHLIRFTSNKAISVLNY